jgi:hypothetical protein
MARSLASRLVIGLLFALGCVLTAQTACIASTVVLEWDPVAEQNIAGYRVYYQADLSSEPFSGTGAAEGAAPIDVLNQTSASVSGLDPARPYYFAVTAYDSDGTESPYSNIVSVPELVSPTVSISSPAGNSNVYGTVFVTADATDNVGVTRVEYYVNGALQASDESFPYVYSWDTSSLPAGGYSLMARAYDAAGNVGQTGLIPVTVVSDTAAPTVAITAPTDNATVKGIVAIAASAIDDAGVSRVEFYVNGTLVSMTNVTPYNYAWDTTSVATGVSTLFARAYDGAGNVGQSANVRVTVNNGDATAPIVAIGSPTENAAVKGKIKIAASASDNVGVTKVGFYVDEVLMYSTLNPPYSYIWNTASTAAGYHTITVRAWDAAGNTGQASVSVRKR